MENNESFEKVEVYDSPEALAAGMAASAEQPQQETQEAPQQEPSSVEEPSTVQEIVQEQTPPQEQQVDSSPEQYTEYADENNDEYSDDEIEDAVFSYLSEKLGRDVESYDDFTQTQQTALDERVEAIANFVEETGRSPQDWFTYQSLNPLEMDDMAAVRFSMAVDYSIQCWRDIF